MANYLKKANLWHKIKQNYDIFDSTLKLQKKYQNSKHHKTKRKWIEIKLTWLKENLESSNSLNVFISIIWY